MLPMVFSENLFDDLFNDTLARSMWNTNKELYGKNASRLMKTDVHETEDSYELAIDLPGFKKEEINVDLKDGYLTISATKSLDKDEEDKKGKYIRKERYAGALSRTFYLGEEIREEEIKAKFENGIMSVSIPKEEEKKVEGPKHISIEG